MSGLLPPVRADSRPGCPEAQVAPRAKVVRVLDRSCPVCYDTA